jgi:peroxiredoxin Q/BCP
VALLVGAHAPTFTLPGWHQGAERTFTLADSPGTPVVVAFYPGDERMVCTRQMCSYSDNLLELHRFEAQVWGISPQGVDSHRDFAAGRRLELPLLSDVGNHVAQSFGVVGAFGLRRSVFVVGSDRRITWRWVSATNLTFPGIPHIVAALKQGKQAA